MRVVFVHGACVKDGSWWWHRTAELLAERGVASEAPALPSCGETGGRGAQGPGLAEDVASVRQVLTASDEPTVVVAHSYGGIVTAEAAAGVDAVRHLLLVSSYLPEVGQSLSSFGGEEPAPFLDIDPEGGTFTVRPESLAETFLQDCDPEIQRQALDKTARQSLAVLAQPVQSAAWQHVPSTYLVCAQDRGTPADLQREFAGRATSVVELDAGHHPFLSRPAERPRPDPRSVAHRVTEVHDAALEAALVEELEPRTNVVGQRALAAAHDDRARGTAGTRRPARRPSPGRRARRRRRDVTARGSP